MVNGARLACEPFVVFTSAMAFMGFHGILQARACIHRLAPSAQIPYSGLNFHMEASHLRLQIWQEKFFI